MISLERTSNRVLNWLIARGVTRKNASLSLDRNIISREWRKLCNAQNDDERMDAAVDILLSVLSYLAKIGCNDIETRIFDRLSKKRNAKRDNETI